MIHIEDSMFQKASGSYMITRDDGCFFVRPTRPASLAFGSIWLDATKANGSGIALAFCTSSFDALKELGFKFELHPAFKEYLEKIFNTAIDRPF